MICQESISVSDILDYYICLTFTSVYFLNWHLLTYMTQLHNVHFSENGIKQYYKREEFEQFIQELSKLLKLKKIYIPKYQGFLA